MSNSDEPKVKNIIVSLDSEHYKPNKRIEIVKGKNYIDSILGERENTADYTEVGDILLIPKRFFNKEYKLKVLQINTNKDGNIYCNTRPIEYIPKKVLNFINSLEVKKFKSEHDTRRTINKQK